MKLAELRDKRVSILVIGVIALFAILIGGIFVWQYSRITEESKVTDYSEVSTLPDFLPIKIVQKLTCEHGKMHDPLEPGDFYYYQIDPNTQIIFKVTKDKEEARKEGSFPPGDVILRQGEEETFLLRDIWLTGPSGETFSVSTTNLPTIFLIEVRAGDMGWWFIDRYYFDLSQEEIVFTAKDDQGYELIVEKKGFPSIKLDLEIDDQCGRDEQRTGTQAKIVGLTLNDKITEGIDRPIEIDCIDPGGIGPIYSPDPNLEIKSLDSNFSKLSFSLTFAFVGETEEKEALKQDFYINLTDPNNIKILKIK